MLLNKPVSAPLLKEWLIHLNLTIPTLRQNIRANKNYTAPRWPLDASTCQNDKLIFITPPVLKDGVVDQFQGDRIQLVEKERGALPLNLDPIDADYNDREGRQVLNKKRKAAGKPEHKFKTKTVDDVQVLIDAGKITISEIKEERDFVYMNLNGGDSWGYWHSVTNPKILYNFKGEPNLLLEDVAPGYYYSALKKAKEVKQKKAEADGGVTTSNGISYLAFTRSEDGGYYIGTYDHNADKAEVKSIPSRLQVIDFLKQHGLPTPDFLPHWSATYDFHTTKQIDFDRRWINMYKPSEYIVSAQPGVTEIPPTSGTFK
jgi:hypothetical protein